MDVSSTVDFTGAWLIRGLLSPQYLLQVSISDKLVRCDACSAIWTVIFVNKAEAALAKDGLTALGALIDLIFEVMATDYANDP